MNLASTIAAEESSGGSGIFTLGILLLIPVAMYFLLIRPQRRRVRDQQSLQRSIQIGDEVVTAAGIFGTITGEDDESDAWWIEVDDDIQIRVLKAAVTSKVRPDAPAATSADVEADDQPVDGPVETASIEPPEPAPDDAPAKNKRT
ncbi:MAG TPA: preprotein translocase subunit YajC [Ilumatobacteraceae bacterium]